MKTCGIILSGGQGRRVGGADKGQLPWRDSTRIEGVVSAMEPQVDTIVISANRNIDWYAGLGYPVFSDSMPDYQGPLAGLAACLPHCEADICITAPCDSPLLPDDLAHRLLAGLNTGTDICCAHDGDRAQNLFLAFPTDRQPELLDYLDKGGRSVKGWLNTLRLGFIDFSDRADCFINLNE